jgi:hypothetical protein
MIEGGLRNGSKKICAGEKLLIFIQVLKGLSLRSIGDRFQHSEATLSAIIREVSNSLIIVQDKLMIQPKANQPDSARILNDPKFSPFFNGCIGAIDGTFIPAIVPYDLQKRFRNRKGQVAQNVMGVVGWDMTFSYILAGWEGSAHDGKVYQDALGKGLAVFAGKYYLADAGYALSTVMDKTFSAPCFFLFSSDMHEFGSL